MTEEITLTISLTAAFNTHKYHLYSHGFMLHGKLMIFQLSHQIKSDFRHSVKKKCTLN